MGMPSKEELIGHGRDEEQIAAEIGADRLFYQDLEDLIDAVLYKKSKLVSRFDTSVFNGEYVTGDVDEEYLRRLEESRSDSAKSEREQRDFSVIDLYNTD